MGLALATLGRKTRRQPAVLASGCLPMSLKPAPPASVRPGEPVRRSTFRARWTLNGWAEGAEKKIFPV